MIGEGAAGLGAIVLFAAAGWGLTALSPVLRWLPAFRRLGYAYLLGLAAVAGGAYALSHWAQVPLRGAEPWIAAALSALVALAVDLGRRRGRHRPLVRRRRERDRWVLAAAGFAALVLLGLAADAALDPLKDWDGRMTWSAQARYVRAAGTVDAPILQQKRWFVTHPQYPLLLPVAQVLALDAFARDEGSHAFRMLYVGIFAAWLLVAYDGARRLAGRRPAALAVALAAATPFVQYGEGGASSAYSDLPLAAFYGAALVLLLAAPPRWVDGWVAGLLLGAAVLAKNEGLPLAIMALALAVARVIALGRARSAQVRARLLIAPSLAVAVALAAIALLLSWRAGVPNRFDEKYATDFRLGALWPAVVVRAPRLVPVLLRTMLDWQRWNGFWCAALALLAAGWPAAFRLRRLPLWAAALAPPAIGWLAYAVAIDPERTAEVTWERFLLQGSVPLLMLVAVALSDVLRRAFSAPGGQGSPTAGQAAPDRAPSGGSARLRDSRPGRS